MPFATGFSNSWTSGEIFEDADDRTDIQPVAKACAQATNLVIQPTGPLKKRRGLWWLGAVADSTKKARLIPFRRSVSNALMLEFGDLSARVWSANGSPLIDPGTGLQTVFTTPWAHTQLANLRYKQVADVIYFTSSDGMQPRALSRLSDYSWSFNTLGLTNGPWQTENIDQTWTLTLTGASDITDANPAGTGAKAMMTGQTGTVTASKALFTAAMVGDRFRIRQSTGAPSMRSWFSGYYLPVGWFVTYGGNVYESTATAGSTQQQSMSTPPVQTSGSQNDGCNTLLYLHDGAGVIEITGYTSSTVAAFKVISTLPVGNSQATFCWAQGAYGTDTGWPRAWPSAVEERLVMGATTEGLDFIDLSRTAGFTPTTLDFHPGQGTGNVVATDACRRRLGDDGGEIIWTRQSTFLIAGTASGEFVISGGLFGDPISPSTIICRPISNFGSANVYPALLEKGLAYVTSGGQGVRTVRLDLQQNDGGQDVSFLAHHIEIRTFSQLCYIKAPDRVCWARLADGGLAALTLYPEQEVKGWTTQALATPAAGALSVDDIVSIPGPGLYETLWMLASGTVAGAFTRMVLMLSQVSDQNFLDLSSLYAGAPASTIGDLSYLNGETVTIVANGVQQLPQVVSAGAVSVPAGTTKAIIGLPYTVTFKSLKLDIASLGGTLMARQRVAGCTVDLLATACAVGYSGGLTELSTSRQAADVAGPVARRYVDRVTFGGDISTDPRISIVESTAYDFGIFALRPTVVGEQGAQRGG